MDLRRNQALRASMHVCGAARRGDAAADRRDAASRSRVLQIVTTIPIQTPPTKASRVEGETRGGEEELVNTLESRRLVRRILSRTVVSEPLLPPSLSSVFLPSLLSSPPAKSIEVSGIITLSLGYPPTPRCCCCCCEIFRYIYNDLSQQRGDAREDRYDLGVIRQRVLSTSARTFYL